MNKAKNKEASMSNLCGTCNWIEQDPANPVTTCPFCGAKAYYVPVLHAQALRRARREDWTKVGYTDMADCISQNANAGNPAAYCASILFKATGIWPSQDSLLRPRHADFKRIFDGFVQALGAEGPGEYDQWLKDLRLDETKPYESLKEAFRWARDQISRLKEDQNNVYYRVFVGYPWKSMNSNIYTRKDLEATTKSLKGIRPNLNHNETWTFPNVEFEDAQFEDNGSEAILRVGKDVMCPFCGHNQKLHTLIDEKKIVNVSLEGKCMDGEDENKVCRGFRYTGCALLTTDVLPGIPMARIKPLESILSEAFATKKQRNVIVKTEIKDKPKEAEYPWDQCIADQLAAGYDETTAAEICAAIKNRTVSHSMQFHNLSQKEAIQFVLKKKKEDLLFNYLFEKTIPPSTNSGNETGTTACPDGQTWDEQAKQCVPIPTTSDQPIHAPPVGAGLETATLKVDLVKAKNAARELQDKVAAIETSKATVEKSLEETEQNLQRAKGEIDATKETLTATQSKADHLMIENAANKAELHNLQRAVTDLEGAKQSINELTSKYKTQLTANLELTRELTKAKEDFLSAEKAKDQATEQLHKAKRLAKLTLKMQ